MQPDAAAQKMYTEQSRAEQSRGGGRKKKTQPEAAAQQMNTEQRDTWRWGRGKIKMQQINKEHRDTLRWREGNEDTTRRRGAKNEQSRETPGRGGGGKLRCNK